MYLNHIVDKLMPEQRYSEEERALRRFIFYLLVVGQPLLILWAVLWMFVGFKLGAIALMAMFTAQIAMIAMMRSGVSPQFIGHLYCFSTYLTLTSLCAGSGGIISPICAWFFIPVVNAFWINGAMAGMTWTFLSVAGLGMFWLADYAGLPMALYVPQHLTSAVSLGSAMGIVFYFSVVAMVYQRWRREGMQASKALMEQRQHLVSVLGHDLKNPVAGLLGRVYLMEREIGKGNPVDLKQMLIFVREEGSKILESIDRLLLLNRSKMVVEVPVMRNLDLRVIIEKVVDEHTTWMRSKDIRTDLSQVVAQRVYGDEPMLTRLIDNVLTNAVKYSHAGSVVHFEAVQKTEANRSMVELAIIDQGVGMDPREAEQFFKLEYRPNKPTAGESSSGVGASIMREIVAAHDGRIWLTTGGKDCGTKVHILLRSPHHRATVGTPEV